MWLPGAPLKKSDLCRTGCFDQFFFVFQDGRSCSHSESLAAASEIDVTRLLSNGNGRRSRHFLKAAFDITARRIVAGPDPARAPNVEAMIYLDARDRVQMPPMTPFIPMRFTATETNKRTRLDRMWLECGGLMAEQFAKHSFATQVYLPPEFLDLRPFVWKGFTAGMGYTFLVDLPYDESEMDSAVRKQIAKTASAGFVCRRATKADLPAIVDRIRQTEQRQGFAYRVTESVLQKGLEILGEDNFRVYVAIAPAGGMASVRIVLHAAGGDGDRLDCGDGDGVFEIGSNAGADSIHAR